MFELKHALARRGVDQRIETILPGVALLGHQTALGQPLMRPGEIRHVNRHMMAIEGRDRLIGIDESQHLIDTHPHLDARCPSLGIAG